jgi:hypothetical protein
LQVRVRLGVTVVPPAKTNSDLANEKTALEKPFGAAQEALR